jgi:hypothetical protein
LIDVGVKLFGLSHFLLKQLRVVREGLLGLVCGLLRLLLRRLLTGD